MAFEHLLCDHCSVREGRFGNGANAVTAAQGAGEAGGPLSASLAFDRGGRTNG